jgi:hypothetical protein
MASISAVPGPVHAESASLTGQYPQPLEVSLASQFVCACGLARLGVIDGLAGRGMGDGDREGGQELGACLAKRPRVSHSPACSAERLSQPRSTTSRPFRILDPRHVRAQRGDLASGT